MNRLWTIGIFFAAFFWFAEAWALISPADYNMNIPNSYLKVEFGDECYCQVVDSQIGGDNARNPSRPWVGWHWIDPKLTFYFSEGPVDISTILIGFNKDTSIGIAKEDRIFLPYQVNISFSQDGIGYDSPLIYSLNDGLYADDRRHSIQFDTSGFRGQWVRINLYHEYWALIDEILFDENPSTASLRAINAPDPPPVPTPEPGTLLFFGSGLASVGIWKGAAKSGLRLKCPRTVANIVQSGIGFAQKSVHLRSGGPTG